MTIHRKQICLPGFDYASVGAYFVTICTVDKRNMLSVLPTGVDNAVHPCIAPTCVGADDSVRPNKLPQLTDLGRMVEMCIHGIPAHLPNVHIDNDVIMPNHIHLLLQITTDRGGQSRPPYKRLYSPLNPSQPEGLGMQDCGSYGNALFTIISYAMMQIIGESGNISNIIRFDGRKTFSSKHPIERNEYYEKCTLRPLCEVRQGI